MAAHLRLRTVQEQQPLQASKWLQLQLLIDAQEMQDLLHTLGDFFIYLTGAVIPMGAGELSHATFGDIYRRYVDDLSHGRTPDDTTYRQPFSAVFTRTVDALYALDTGDGKVIIRPTRPVIQLQLHQLGFSQVDHKFRSMVYGKDSLSWGIQFSYPQIFEDPVTRQIHPVNRSEAFPNSFLFHDLQRWVRKHTLPTPFLVNGKRVNVPVRLGKTCFAWIHQHPQLSKHGLAVKSD